MADWVCVQLQYTDNINSDIVVDNFKSILPIEVFLPSIKFKDKRGEYTYSLFDGYAFVRGDKLTDKEYFKLLRSPYISQILTTTPSSGKISYVANLEIDKLKAKLQEMLPAEFEEGQEIFIHQGLFSGLTGTVMGIEQDKLMIEIKMPLGSLTKLTRIPKMFVRAKDETE